MNNKLMAAICMPLKLTAETMLCLGDGAPRLLSTSSTESTLRLRANKLHSNHQHTSLSIASSRTSRRPLRHVFRPVVILARDGSKEERVQKGTKEVHSRSLCMAALRGGKFAVERFADYYLAPKDTASLEEAECQLCKLLGKDLPDFNELQSTVAKLEMSGKEAAAIKILERELEEANEEGKSQQAYEIGMLLVEMYIYKGDFEEALNRRCLTDEAISDARRPLYKAIIHIMLEHSNGEASDCWEKFKNMPPPPDEDSNGEAFNCCGRLLFRDIKDFEEFKSVVESLKKDIQSARAKGGT